MQDQQTTCRIKTGDKIRILPNVTAELKRLGFTDPSCFDRLIGTEQTAYDVYDAGQEDEELKGEIFITIDLCAEMPLAAVELIPSSQTI